MTQKKPLTVKCPTCRKDVDWHATPARPFCCDRCRLIDLGRWADGEYRIEGDKKPEEDADGNPFSHDEQHSQ
jgi:uncharacterized protein